jgi:O-succinylbenzoic acid--CoA ligase
MEGYGYPPDVEPGADRNGWSPTEDIGAVDDAGDLTLFGRADQCFKASSGHLVSPDHVADVLETHPAVSGAVVVPLSSPRGLLIGALVESAGALDSDEIRRYASRALPAWMQPQVVGVTRELPRLPGGKPDRQRLIRQLEALL